MALVSGVMLLGVRLACVSDDMIKDKDAAMSVILIESLCIFVFHSPAYLRY